MPADSTSWERPRFLDPDYSVAPGLYRGRTWDVCRGRWVEEAALSDCHWRYMANPISLRDYLRLVGERYPGTPQPPAETPVPPVSTPSPAPSPPTPPTAVPMPPTVGGGRYELPPRETPRVPPSLVMGLGNAWPASRRDVDGGAGETEKKPCWICIVIALAAVWALTQGCAVRVAFSEELEIGHPTLELRVPRAPAEPEPAAAARYHAEDCATFTVRRP